MKIRIILKVSCSLPKAKLQNNPYKWISGKTKLYNIKNYNEKLSKCK